MIHNRPSWVNQNNINNITINNQWNNAFLRPSRPNWWVRPVGRPDRWNTWGFNVRHGWNHWGYYNNWFTNSWWHGHYHSLPGWHYGYWFNRYPSYYWWRRPAWTPLAAWFTWTAAPQVVWQQPVYYDYGPQGNVQYQNNVVYVGGQPVASAASYAMTAAELATVPPPESEEQAEAEEWMPLGTFAVSSSEQDVDPNRVLQLAVSKTGIISGALFNSSTDAAQGVQGKVDPNTQRVAFRVGENENVVVETGLGNLTQNEAAALVHYGPDRQETWLLVRLDNPDDPEAPATEGE